MNIEQAEGEAEVRDGPTPPPAPPPPPHPPPVPGPPPLAGPPDHPQTVKQAPEDPPRELRVPAVPVALMAAEAAVISGALMWHLAGPGGLAACAVTAAGGTAWLARRRPSARRRSRPRPARVDSPAIGRVRQRGGVRSGPSTGTRSRRFRTASGGPLKGLGGRGTTTGGTRTGRPPRRPLTAPGANAAPGVARRAAQRRAAALRAGKAAVGRAKGGASATRRAVVAAHKSSRDGGSRRAAAKAARVAAGRSGAGGRGGRVRRWSAAAGWTVLGWLWASGYRGACLVWRVMPKPGGRPERPRINTTVDRPDHPGPQTTSPTHRTGAEPMSAGAPRFVHAAEEFADALARYHPGPDGMVGFLADMQHVPDALESIARGMAELKRNCDEEWPLKPAIAELVGALARVQQQMAADGAQIAPAIRRLHADDLKRHEAPRRNEQMWNVPDRRT